MARWALHCGICDWEPDPASPIGDTKAHWDAHTDEERAAFDDDFTLKLVPHCPDDDAPLTLSESGDSGQCPTCGRYEILRVPEEFR